ncbi:MAG: thiamine pyrophosphate-binding protein [Actinophytocola sp.]|nr:thiamine pyrophosphate-binding protein [Actinophytocola sp.]
MPYRDGGQLLAELLRDAGVDTVFGVASIHNLPLVEAASTELRFVPVRHEAAAVNAADGYARARGGLGCALTSTGTGAGNAAGSLIEALAAGSPVLHITSQIPTTYLGQGRGFIHETKDQAGMLAAVSRRALTITNPSTAAAVLAGAVRDALTAPGGPVSVEWPIDLQHLASDSAVDPIDPAGAPEREPDGLADAAAALDQARRPVVWVGGGAVGAGEPLGTLVDRLGAAVFTSNAGRGVIAEVHPLCIGNYATTEAGQALLDDADVLLSVGTHFRSNETATYRLRIPSAHIQIDLDDKAIGRVYPVKSGVVGDATAALRGLCDRVTPAQLDSGWRERVRQVRGQVRAAHRDAIGVHAAVCDALRRALPRDGIVARDVTIASSSWGNRLLEIYQPWCNIYARGGGIGQGLAMGIGAATARPDAPVAVIAGDGGLAVHLGELATLAQERPWLVLIVFNDRGYGVLRNLQDAHSRRHAGVDLHTPDFTRLAAAFELPHALITNTAHADDVFADAVARRGPVVVEVDVDALGPMPELFTPPVEAADDELVGEEGP